MKQELPIALAVFLFHKDKLLIAKSSQYGAWLAIGGHMYLGETFLDTIHREIKEETNLTARIVCTPITKLERDAKTDALPFFAFHRPSKRFPGMRTLIISFAGVLDDISSLHVDKNEIAEYKWITLEELKHFEDAGLELYERACRAKELIVQYGF